MFNAYQCNYYILCTPLFGWFKKLLLLNYVQGQWPTVSSKPIKRIESWSCAIYDNGDFEVVDTKTRFPPEVLCDMNETNNKLKILYFSWIYICYIEYKSIPKHTGLNFNIVTKQKLPVISCSQSRNRIWDLMIVTNYLMLTNNFKT